MVMSPTVERVSRSLRHTGKTSNASPRVPLRECVVNHALLPD
jgi:hypothetical protein